MAKKKKYNAKSPEKLNFVVYAIMALIVVAVPNVYSEKVLDNTLMPRFVGVVVFMFLAMGYYFFNMKKTLQNADFSIFKKPIYPIYLVFLILTLISSSYAINSSEALFDFFKIFTFFSIFLFFSLFFTENENTGEAFVKMFIIFSLLASLIGIINYINLANDEGVKTVKSIYQVRGNFAHKNLLSQSLLVSLGFTIYGFLKFENLWKILGGIASATAIVLITILLSRAVWVSFSIAMAVSIVLYLFFTKKDLKISEKIKPLAKILGVILIIIALSAGIFTISGNEKSIQKHVTEASDFKSGSTFHRLDLWTKTSGVIKDNLLLGVGAANWKTEVINYGIGDQTPQGSWKYPVRPHNDYLWVLSELGIGGFLLFLSMLGFVAYYLFSFLKKTENEDDKLFTIALIFAFVAYLIFSSFSFPKERIESQIFLHLIFAYAVSNFHNLKKEKSAGVSKAISWGGGILVTVVLIFALVAGMQRINTEAYLQKIIGFQKNKKPALIIPLAEKANQKFATLDHAGLPILWYKGISQVQTNRLKKGEKTLLQALDIHPYHPTIYLGLAYAYDRQGNTAESEKYVRKALKIHPDDKKALTNLAVLFNKQGKEDSIFQVISKIPPRFKDKNFGNLMITELSLKAKSLIDTTDRKRVQKFITQKANNPKWLMEKYTENWSKDTEINFEKIFLQEIIKEAEEKKFGEKAMINLNQKLEKLNN